jgi:hypothetical protein
MAADLSLQSACSKTAPKSHFVYLVNSVFLIKATAGGFTVSLNAEDESNFH